MISLELGKSLESYVENLVKTGRYNSKSEVLREGLRMLQEREQQFAALDAVIMRGVAASDAGQGKNADEVFDRLQKKYGSMQDH
ncbi:type II toxin-antitoxin system ParD family antitoxin [Microvirga sp. W0021]|uniref:Type II toxin-antitoxin system ParD family antitoxin n=1 Tax=Hohaiivirga grylli TaxID=3133970 RepID=A0ABV0BM93_9HYPH